MIISSAYVTLIALLVATPLSVGAAIYLSEYASEGKLVAAIRFGAETLSSIPSIIFGLFWAGILRNIPGYGMECTFRWTYPGIDGPPHYISDF